MGVRTGVRCCGEAIAGGRGSAIFSFFFFLVSILLMPCVRSETTLRTSWVVGGRCSKRVSLKTRSRLERIGTSSNRSDGRHHKSKYMSLSCSTQDLQLNATIQGERVSYLYTYYLNSILLVSSFSSSHLHAEVSNRLAPSFHRPQPHHLHGQSARPARHP